MYDYESEREHYFYMRDNGVKCRCERCGTHFIGLPGHGVCNPCADALECGMDLGFYDDDSSENP